VSTLHRIAPSSLIAAALLAGVAGVGCTGQPSTAAAPPAGNEQVKAEYDKTGKLQKIEYDRDKDGKPDTWGYMDGSRVVRVEMDRNGDGRVDRWEYHSATGEPTPPPAPEDAVDPSLERIEESTRFDGTVSRKEFFVNGVLAKTEEDTDGNGAVDKWEVYERGALAALSLDTTGRGTPDRRLIYKNGGVDHVETDPSGIGTFTPAAP
jgi:antitoxin component YwqK of YwqJK toxin-antitoxin module